MEEQKKVQRKKKGPTKYHTDADRIAGQKAVQRQYYLRNRQKYLDRGKEQYLEKMRDHEYVNISKYAHTNEKSEEDII